MMTQNDDQVVFSGPDRSCWICVEQLGMASLRADARAFRELVREAERAVASEQVVGALIKDRDAILRRLFIRAALLRRLGAVRGALAAIPRNERARIRERLCGLARADRTDRPLDAFDPGRWDVRDVLATCGNHGPDVTLGLAAYFLERQDDGVREALETRHDSAPNTEENKER